MSEYKICPSCSTQNENEYKYCKACGTRLPEFTAAKNPYSDMNNNANNQGFNSGSVDCRNGIPPEYAAAFIGKKASDFMPKFAQLESSGRKVGWCWPVAILGILLGMFGVSLWFLYRKMYKFGFIILACAIILNVAQMSVSNRSMVNYYSQLINVIRMVDTYDSEDINEALESAIQSIDNIKETRTTVQKMADFSLNAISAAGMVVFSLFATYMYKKHTERSLAKLFAQNSGADSVRLAFLASVKGGTSGGMVVLGVFIMLISSCIIWSIPVMEAVYIRYAR